MLRHCLQPLERNGCPPILAYNGYPGPVHLLSNGLRVKMTRSRLNVTAYYLIMDITMYISPSESYHCLLSRDTFCLVGGYQSFGDIYVYCHHLLRRINVYLYQTWQRKFLCHTKCTNHNTIQQITKHASYQGSNSTFFGTKVPSSGSCCSNAYVCILDDV